MKKIYSVCHIGAGRIGFTLEFDKRRAKPATHIGMWEKNKNVKLSAVCEKNEIKKSKLNKISKSAKIYKNYIKAIQIESTPIKSKSIFVFANQPTFHVLKVAEFNRTFHLHL